MTTSLSKTITRQQSHRGSTLANAAGAGYGNSRSTIAKVAYDSKINPNSLPAFPSLDHMPTTASAPNAISASGRLVNLNEQPYTVLNASSVENTVTGALHGYRIPRERLTRIHMAPEAEERVPQKLDLDVMQKNLSSAAYGYRELAPSVYTNTVKRRTHFGDGNYGRRYGLERDANPSIHAGPPTGLDANSATAVPNAHPVRINGTDVAPPLAAAPTFY